MNKKLSIIVPVYNEENTILDILKRINECRINDFDFEIIVVNDGSTDNTLKLIQENSNLFDHLVTFDQNKGKGFAVKKGLKIATGDYIIFQDADLEYSPKDYKSLIDPIVDFVYILYVFPVLQYKNQDPWTFLAAVQ